MVGRSRIPIARLSDPRCRLLLLLRPRPLSTTASPPPSNPDKAAAPSSPGLALESGAREEAYRQLQNLDFMTAAKILFTTPPKRKEFGLDFHLVQFFFVCMPSLAVYLVAQYARYEIRRMEAEAELRKKQAEEEAAAKAAELESIEEASGANLSKVIVRLDALEETVKEIMDERQKASPSDPSKGKEEVGNKEEQAGPVDKPSDPRSKVEPGEPTSDRREMVGGSSPTDVPARDQKERDRKVGNGEPSYGETTK